MKFDREKLKALVLYVIWRVGQADGFGATKLNKALWFSEARHYMMYGSPITGETYIRQPHGPVPEHVDEICRELELEGIVARRTERYFGKDLTRFVADEPPDVAHFSCDELNVVDWWVKHIAEEHTASSISELSHNYAWEIAANGEAIPLYAILSSRIRAPLGKELEWARQEAQRLGLA